MKKQIIFLLLSLTCIISHAQSDTTKCTIVYKTGKMDSGYVTFTNKPWQTFKNIGSYWDADTAATATAVHKSYVWPNREGESLYKPLVHFLSNNYKEIDPSQVQYAYARWY